MNNMRILLASISFVALAVVPRPLLAADASPLCPTPVHLARQVDDPLVGRTMKVDEYCLGDRIVTVRGARVTIVDYRLQEVTEIDHNGATYSVTRFDEIAKVRAKKSTAGGGRTKPSWKVTPLGLRSASARSLDSFEIAAGDGGHSEKIEVGVDRRVGLSRAAAEAFLGASYPNVRTGEHDAILGVCAGRSGGDRLAATAAAPEQYGLVAEQTTTYEQEGTVIVFRNSVTAVDAATAPPESLLIDPGARKVESRLTRVDNELDDVDRLPGQPRKP